MMTLSETYYLYLLLASNVLVLAGGLVAIIRFRQLCKEQASLWNSPPTGAGLADVDEKSDELRRQQLTVNLQLDKQIQCLRRELRALSNRGNEANVPERSLPVDNAVRMARNGASIDDLTRSCGLNIGEAQLIKKMHGAATKHN